MPRCSPVSPGSSGLIATFLLRFLRDIASSRRELPEPEGWSLRLLSLLGAPLSRVVSPPMPPRPSTRSPADDKVIYALRPTALVWCVIGRGGARLARLADQATSD